MCLQKSSCDLRKRSTSFGGLFVRGSWEEDSTCLVPNMLNATLGCSCSDGYFNTSFATYRHDKVVGYVIGMCFFAEPSANPQSLFADAVFTEKDGRMILGNRYTNSTDCPIGYGRVPLHFILPFMAPDEFTSRYAFLCVRSGASSTWDTAIVSTTPSFGTGQQECWPLVVSSHGGTVLFDPVRSPNCSVGYFVSGTSVHLTATADPNFVFLNLTGEVTVSALPHVFTTRSRNMALTASFAQCWPLTLLGSGTRGNVGMFPKHSPGCTSGYFLHGALITLNASALGNNSFAGWAGGLHSSTPSVIFHMPAAPSNITALWSSSNSLACYPVNRIAHNVDRIILSPLASPGCAESSFVAGTAVQAYWDENERNLFSSWRFHWNDEQWELNPIDFITVGQVMDVEMGA